MAGGGLKDPEDMITDINVTPLVDIILVLLIIFMLTANLIATPSIEVDLPQASTGEGIEPTTLAITMTRDGEMFLNGVPTDEAALIEYLPKVVREDPKAQAVIAADREVAHGTVVRIIDLVRRGGIFRFAINIDPTAEVLAPQQP
jgi:biopolymer transport protein ExbD